MKSIVVYQAYGPKLILEQNLFSLISLLKISNGLAGVEKILIYTDQADYFGKFLGDFAAVRFQPMDPERLKQWRGTIEFVHRVKVEMLRDAASLFPQYKIFYLDGDTRFLQDPSPLMSLVDERNSVMHESENIIEKGRDPLSKKIARFLKSEEFKIDERKLKIPLNTVMWNAGVLGFAPSFFGSLEKVLNFTDQAYGKYRKHIMEQLAFSYFLGAQTQIHGATDYIHHYWRQKDEFSALISEFLAKKYEPAERANELQFNCVAKSICAKEKYYSASRGKNLQEIKCRAISHGKRIYKLTSLIK